MTHNHITPTYPWYNPSRISAWRSTGEGEAIARLLIKNRPLIVATLFDVVFEEVEGAEEAEEIVFVDEVMELPKESSPIENLITENLPTEDSPTESSPIDNSPTLDVIETFLKCDNLRIVAQEGGATNDVIIEVELEDIDDLVTEELAEIYIAQGLIDEGKAIYTKLSLLNSEKSVYFAELIENIDKNIGKI
ncbi:MAG: hypothetical protein SNG27_01520 [Rikenellaceae bacterium]